MQFMVQVRATPETEAGVMPSAELMSAMLAFNEDLARRGMMVAGEGLKDSSHGARISWTDGQPTVIDGPFAETKELIAGFWIIKAASLAEVVETFKRCPPVHDNGSGTIEIRPIFDLDDFPEESFTADVRAAEERLRNELQQGGGPAGGGPGA